MSSSKNLALSIKVCSGQSSRDKLKNTLRSHPYNSKQSLKLSRTVDLNGTLKSQSKIPILLSKNNDNQNSLSRRRLLPMERKKEQLKNVFLQENLKSPKVNSNFKSLMMDDIYIDMPQTKKKINNTNFRNSEVKQFSQNQKVNLDIVSKFNVNKAPKKPLLFHGDMEFTRNTKENKIPSLNLGSMFNKKLDNERKIQTSDISFRQVRQSSFNKSSNTTRQDYSMENSNNSYTNRFTLNNFSNTERSLNVSPRDTKKNITKRKYQLFILKRGCLSKVPGPGAYDISERLKPKIVHSFGTGKRSGPAHTKDKTPGPGSYESDHRNHFSQRNKSFKSNLGKFSKSRKTTCENLNDIYIGPGRYNQDKMPKQIKPEYSFPKDSREASCSSFREKSPNQYKIATGPGLYENHKVNNKNSEHRRSPSFSMGKDKRTSEAEQRLRAVNTPGSGRYNLRGKPDRGKAYSIGKDKRKLDLSKI